jgi:hypothetical protein
MARRKEVPESKPGLPDLDKYLSGRKRHYVTYLEGARLYQLPYQTFVRLAKSGLQRYPAWFSDREVSPAPLKSSTKIRLFAMH